MKVSDRQASSLQKWMLASTPAERELRTYKRKRSPLGIGDKRLELMLVALFERNPDCNTTNDAERRKLAKLVIETMKEVRHSELV